MATLFLSPPKLTLSKLLLLIFGVVVLYLLIAYECHKTTIHNEFESYSRSISHLFISNESKIFEIGVSKTGTSSLGAAFMRLRYKQCSWNGQLFDDWKRTGNVDNIINASKTCNAFRDGPWHDIDFKIWLAHYPNAKFILLDRDDKSWLNSKEKWESPQYNVAQIARKYLNNEWVTNREQMKEKLLQLKHNKYENIINYFHKIGKQSQLLIMNLALGDGWDKLCPFLNNTNPPWCYSPGYTLRFPKLNVHKK